MLVVPSFVLLFSPSQFYVVALSCIPSLTANNSNQALVLLILLHQNSLVFSNQGHESVAGNDVNRPADGGLKKKEQVNVNDMCF